jgi:transcriptional regulator with XRE-family HTH domain
LARVGKQWSVADLAERAGVAVSAISAVEAGDGRLHDYVAASMVLGFGHELWNASRPRPTSLDELERIELARCEHPKG